MISRRCRLFVVVLFLVSVGCGPEASTVDATPFRQAIETYLSNNNMAMAIKEVKQGPDVEGTNAQLKASLVHETLGGPSVTWTFYFEQSGEAWTVVRHED